MDRETTASDFYVESITPKGRLVWDTARGTPEQIRAEYAEAGYTVRKLERAPDGVHATAQAAKSRNCRL